MALFIALVAGLPKRVQIEQQLRERIRSGRLSAGMSVPASRALAEDPGVSRGVIADAYSQLVAEGYLVARRGAGTRVSDSAQSFTPIDPEPFEEVAPVRYEMRSGVPDPAGFPRRAWQSASAQALRELPDADLLGPHRGGLARLRSRSPTTRPAAEPRSRVPSTSSSPLDWHRAWPWSARRLAIAACAESRSRIPHGPITLAPFALPAWSRCPSRSMTEASSLTGSTSWPWMP